MNKLTLHQYNTIKAIWKNNNQGKSFDEYLEAVCIFKDLEYDPSIHDEIEPKAPLKEHIKRSKAGLGASGKSIHKHEWKRTERTIDNNKTLVQIVCKCGKKTAIDLI